jgi:hypothetical protein
MNPELRRTVREAVHDGIARTLAAIGLLGIGLIHLLDIPGKFGETPYMAWMYVALIVGSALLAAAFARTSAAWAWQAAAALAASVVVGYVLSRTTGLPQAADDIGNWSEPLGNASLFVEGGVFALSTAVLWERRTAQSRAARPRRLRVEREMLPAA